MNIRSTFPVCDLQEFRRCWKRPNRYINESQYKCPYILLIFILSSRLQITHSWTFEKRNNAHYCTSTCHLAVKRRCLQILNHNCYIHASYTTTASAQYSRTPVFGFCAKSQSYDFWLCMHETNSIIVQSGAIFSLK